MDCLGLGFWVLSTIMVLVSSFQLHQIQAKANGGRNSGHLMKEVCRRMFLSPYPLAILHEPNQRNLYFFCLLFQGAISSTRKTPSAETATTAGKLSPGSLLWLCCLLLVSCLCVYYFLWGVCFGFFCGVWFCFSSLQSSASYSPDCGIYNQLKCLHRNCVLLLVIFFDKDQLKIWPQQVKPGWSVTILGYFLVFPPLYFFLQMEKKKSPLQC